MGFRFRRSLKILPGVKINFSKSSPSISIGPRGAKTTIGARGIRQTLGIPGTGLSYTHVFNGKDDKLAALTVPQLKNILKEAGLPTTGKKAELIDRIEVALAEEGREDQSSGGQRSAAPAAATGCLLPTLITVATLLLIILL